jgi:hypothetical protein
MAFNRGISAAGFQGEKLFGSGRNGYASGVSLPERIGVAVESMPKRISRVFHDRRPIERGPFQNAAIIPDKTGVSPAMADARERANAS